MHLATLRERGGGPRHDGRSYGGRDGASLAEDLLVQVQQGAGEVVDGADGAERHGGVLPPQQVRPEHHGQVRVGHLIRLALRRHLEEKNRTRLQPTIKISFNIIIY